MLDKNIIEQAKQGSETAFTKIYNEYNGLIFATIRKLLKNTEVSQDVASETWVKIHKKIDTFEDTISFEAWIKTIAINSAIDFTRRVKKEQYNVYIDDSEKNSIQLEELSTSPEEQFVQNEDLQIAIECIPLLNKKCRDVINARVFEGMTYKEIAKKLAITESSVKTYLAKARQRLKSFINKNLSENDKLGDRLMSNGNRTNYVLSSD